jgi:hypothetical protein
MNDHNDIEYQEKQDDELGFFIGFRNVLIIYAIIAIAVILIRNSK